MYEPGQYGTGNPAEGIYADEPQAPVYDKPSKFGGIFSGNQSMLTYIILGVLVLSLLLSLFAIISLGTAKRSLRSSLDAMETTVSSLRSDINNLQSANMTLQGRIATLEAGPATPAAPAAPTGTSAAKIEWAPSNVSTLLGRNEALLFCVAISGINNLNYDSFTWQKLTTNNTWEDITFTDSKNTDLGIRLYTDFYGGYKASDGVTYGTAYSQLWCAGLTENAFGSYRCALKDSNGNVTYTEPAIVSERVEENG